ncbi:MAG: hypothetical protein LC114_11350 [Bryobacterales bacterium]|nr:hypothetical protein [Bryobacterales bacterium]
MKNAHLRVGSLQFIKVLRDTTTDITLNLDRIIVEPTTEGTCSRCHFLSVIGNDQEIGAIAAAIADDARFYAAGAGMERSMVSLGKDAEVYRSSISVPGRRRPLRHLVALSDEMSRTRAGGDARARRTIVIDDDPSFLLYRLGARFGLPILPEWGHWFGQMVQRQGAIQPLIGIGCSPVIVKGTKKRFLGWIGHALKRGQIRIPDQQRPSNWQVHTSVTSLIKAAES